MRFGRTSAIAGSLLLAPHFGFAEEPGVVWRNAGPVWEAAGSPEWLNGPPSSPWAPDWLKDVTPVEGSEGPCRTEEPLIRAIEEKLPAPTPKAVLALPDVLRRATDSDDEILQAGLWIPRLAQLESLAHIPPREVIETAVYVETAEPDQPTDPVLLDDQPSRPDILPPVGKADDAAPKLALLPQRTGDSPYTGIVGRRAIILPPDREVAGQAALGKPREASVPDNSFIESVAPVGPRLRVRGEFLMWWVSKDGVPALATTGDAAGGGIIGQPGTVGLFGPGNIGLSERYGGRFRAALALDDCGAWGIDGSYLFLGRRSSSYAVNSDNSPVLSRPVFVLNNNQEGVESVARPGAATGSLQIDSASRLWGFDANVFHSICSNCERSLVGFVGYRYLNLTENIDIQENIVAGAANPVDPPGTRVTVRDHFATRNIFSGPQVGVNLEQRWERWFVDLRASVALGCTHQTVDIQGSQTRTRPGQATENFVGGLLAAQSNIGSYSRNRFSVVPDVAVNLGYSFTPYLRGYVGYSFLYWTNVARPGEQIDRTVDLTFIPNTPPVAPSGQRRPGVLFNQTDFWAHGLNLGVEWIW